MILVVLLVTLYFSSAVLFFVLFHNVKRSCYLFIFAGKPFNISNIVVQGAKDARDWPYKFRLEHSLDGMVFSKLTQNQTSCLVSDQTKDVSTKLSKFIFTRTSIQSNGVKTGILFIK